MSILSNVTPNIWAGSKGLDFVDVINFQLMFSFIVVEMEDC